MGEYADNVLTGDRIKLGTCEDLFYVTRADLEALSAAGWIGDTGENVRTYLDCKVSRVALPRVYDIAGDVDTINKREPFYKHRYRIGINPDVAEAIREVEHTRMYFNKAQTNFFVPCPLGKDWTPEMSKQASRIHPHIDLIAEGVGPRPRAVYECPYCSTKFNLRGHSAQLAVLTMFKDQWTMGNNKLPDRVAKYLENLIGACDIPAESVA